MNDQVELAEKLAWELDQIGLADPLEVLDLLDALAVAGLVLARMPEDSNPASAAYFSLL